MKVTLLPSSVTPGAEANQFLTTFVIDDVIAVDAGSLGLLGSTEAQARIKNVFLTHSHIDHVATLPIFVENVFEDGSECPTIHASEDVIDCLRRDMFNGRLWPDFIGMSTPESPFLKLSVMKAGVSIRVGDLRVTAIEVDHLVPTVGVVIEGPDASVVIAGDTGPTNRLWEAANALPNLKAVFLEAAFPDELGWLADASKHMTPGRFGHEMTKIRPGVPVFVVHIKPKYHDRIAAELAKIARPGIQICTPGRIYEF